LRRGPNAATIHICLSVRMKNSRAAQYRAALKRRSEPAPALSSPTCRLQPAGARRARSCRRGRCGLRAGHHQLVLSAHTAARSVRLPSLYPSPVIRGHLIFTFGKHPTCRRDFAHITPRPVLLWRLCRGSQAPRDRTLAVAVRMTFRPWRRHSCVLPRAGGLEFIYGTPPPRPAPPSRDNFAVRFPQHVAQGPSAPAAPPLADQSAPPPPPGRGVPEDQPSTTTRFMSRQFPRPWRAPAMSRVHNALDIHQ